MLTDTHVHFDGMIAAGDTLDTIVMRAAQAGVSRMIAIGGSPAANRTALEIARAYPGRIRAAVGYNRDQAVVARRQTPDDGCRTPDAGQQMTDAGRQPARHSPLGEGGTTDQASPTALRHSASRRREGYALARARPEKTDTEKDGGGRMPDDGRRTPDDGKRTMDELEAMLAVPEVVAVGEIGLDFHHDRATVAAQIFLFNRMLALARVHRLPVCVHTREAEDETLGALRAHAAAWPGPAERIGVMHCFTGGEGFARDLLALGFWISFSGIITFKNAGGLRAVAALVPEDRLLIETDAPYLAPEPFRGQPNEPAHVRRVAEVLAEIRHTSWEAIAEISARNAGKMFF